MLKIKDLLALSVEEVEAKAKEVSGVLIDKLISRGILKEDGDTKFISDSMYNLDLTFTVMGYSLSTECEGAFSEEYVIGVTDEGFTVLTTNGEDVYVGILKVLSISDDCVHYVGDFGHINDMVGE